MSPDNAAGNRRRTLWWEWGLSLTVTGGVAALVLLVPIESFVSDVANLLPFGYAFGAGMLTAVSPCGIPMLPVYASLHLGTQEESYWSRPRLRRSGRALLMSAVVTLGFVGFFGIVGAPLSLAGQAIYGVFSWVAVVIGVLLIPLGLYVVAGGHVYSSLPARLASRLGRDGGVGVRGFLVFGVAYAIAALSCTLPVFLVVVAGAVTSQGLALGMLQFVLFALGMGFIIAIVTVAMALSREGVSRWLRRMTPMITLLSGQLLVFAGGYILYFWFVVGDILG